MGKNEDNILSAEDIILGPPQGVDKPEEEKEIFIDISDDQNFEVNENGGGEESQPGEESNPDNKIFLDFARFLKDEDVLPDANLEEFDGQIDGLKELIASQIKQENERYKGSFSDEQKELFEMLEKGFTKEEIIEYKTKEQLVKSITKDQLEDPTVQKKVYENYLKEKGYSDSHIEKLVNIEGDELAKEALKAYDALGEAVKNERTRKEQEKQAAIQAQENERQKILDDLNDQIKKTEEIIPGRKLTEKDRKEIFSMITESKNNMNAVQEVRSKDPYKFEMTLAYLVKQGIFDGDWESIMKVVKKNTASEFEKSLSRTSSRVGDYRTISSIQTEESDESNRIADSLKNIF